MQGRQKGRKKHMIIIAVIATLLAGIVGAFLEPVSFGVSLPVAVMGGFILKAINNNEAKNSNQKS